MFQFKSSSKFPQLDHPLQVIFFTGLHSLTLPKRGNFTYSFISYNILKDRVSNFDVDRWVMDSGAFTEINKHGEFRTSPSEYVEGINRWADCGNLLAAVSQDYMCEDVALKSTGGTVREHQRKTVERFHEIISHEPNTYILPVLQGYKPKEYAEHIDMYKPYLKPNKWVGVGSVCKRNSDVDALYEVFDRIKQKRPDLRLHAFGVKKTALEDKRIRRLLHTADSMAWSFNARYQDRDANSPLEAKGYLYDILSTEKRMMAQYNYEER